MPTYFRFKLPAFPLRYAAIMPLASLLSAGCSLLLDLGERSCSSHSECALDGSMMCMEGICEAVLSTTPGTSTSNDSNTQTSVADTTYTTSGTTSGTVTDSSAMTASDTDMADETTEGDVSTTCASGDCMEDSTSSAGEESSSTTGPAPVPVELIMNNGFETDPYAEWTKFGYGTVIRSMDFAYEGEYSMLTTSRTRAFDSVAAPIASKVLEGVTYRVSTWVLLEPGIEEPKSMGISRKIHCADATNPSYAPVAMGVVRSDEWTELAGNLVIPTGCDAFEAALYLEGALTGVDNQAGTVYHDFYVDEFYVTPQ